MMRIIFLGIFILIFFACADRYPDLKADKSKMIEILADMHVAEEMKSKFREQDKDSVSQLYLMEIAEIHSMDTSEIKENIIIIQSNPELSMEIYTEVYSKLDKLSKEEIQK